jgi:hypothetical protein
MKDALDTREVGSFKVHLMPDEEPFDPRENDNGAVLALFHNRYTLANESGLSTDQFSGWGDMLRHIQSIALLGIVVPVYMIDHSGIALRAGRDFSDCDPGCWDSGQVGFAYCTQDIWDTNVGNEITDATVRGLIEAEVEEYDQYIRGDCYGYIVEDPNGQQLDSCWGYFDSKFALSEGEGSARHYAAQLSTKAALACL